MLDVHGEYMHSRENRSQTGNVPLSQGTYYVCGFHNAREIRDVLAIFSCDLMNDKLGVVGVSGRDPTDDDDEYTLE